MNIKKVIVGGVLAVIGILVALALIAVVSLRLLDRSTGAIVSSGRERQYLLHVPPSYDGATSMPLVITLHGAAGWPAQQMNLSHWNQLADEHGFIVVYPSGSGLPKTWHVRVGEGLTRDVRFIADLIDTLETTYNIDSTRIYANGLSNGGGMTFVLSCTLSDRIAAFGMVAAAQSLPWSWCTDHRPVPMIAFHGTADPIVPYGGGPSRVAPDGFPSVPTWAANWARRNRCGLDPVESVLAADVARREYTNCADDASVVLYTIQGGGHSWPGGKPLPEWMVGRTSNSIDATSAMWAFFREHRLSMSRQDEAAPAPR